jgi:predicted nuclease of predicted toxin-antitoxin system
MNLSPAWVTVLEGHNWPAIHWSKVGDPRASDQEIMAWAQANGYTVFTHDLDFGMLLAVTRARGPSVIQIRGQDVLPAHQEKLIVAVLQEYGSLLEVGALIVVDESKLRVRILPLR